jgi:hypothetical protein
LQPNGQLTAVTLGQFPKPSHIWAGVACFVVVLHEAAGPHAWVVSKFVVGLHTATPVEQSSDPFLQEAPSGGQDEPAAQVPQEPALQTCPVPQVVPLVTLAQVPVATPVLVPRQDLQVTPQALLQHTPSTQVFPVGHWLEVVQTAPFLTFGVQVPAEQ